MNTPNSLSRIWQASGHQIAWDPYSSRSSHRAAASVRNKAFIAFLAQLLGARKSQVEIVAGAASRRKLFRVIALSLEEVEERLLG